MLSNYHLITLAAVEISEGQMEEFANTSSRRASKESVCCPAWTPIPMLSPVLSMSLLLASPIHLRKPQGLVLSTPHPGGRGRDDVSAGVPCDAREERRGGEVGRGEENPTQLGRKG